MSSLFAILMAIGCTSPPTGPQEDVAGPNPTETTTPGQVTDLIVTDSTGTAVTLSFTQVDDGSGNPADYAVRTHVGPMNWGAAEEVSQGTCDAPLQGTAIGSTMSCTIEGLLPDEPYTFQVAAFRGTFQAGAVYGALSNVVPDRGDTSHPNEPAGLSPIVSVDFADGINPQTGACWERESNPSRYVQDISAPTSDGSVFRGTFPAGAHDGVSYWRFDCWGPAMAADGGLYQYDEIYISYWLKIEGADYENQSNGTKVFYIAYGDGSFHNDGYLQLQGTGTQAIQSEITLRAKLSRMDDNGEDTPAFSVDPNLSSKKVQVGEWTKVELRLKINDIGADNGKLDLWVNGTHTTSISDWRFRSTKNPRAFYHLQFTPVYGGNSGDVRTRDDYWRVDNLYVSGR